MLAGVDAGVVDGTEDGAAPREGAAASRLGPTDGACAEVEESRGEPVVVVGLMDCLGLVWPLAVVVASVVVVVVGAVVVVVDAAVVVVGGATDVDVAGG